MKEWNGVNSIQNEDGIGMAQNMKNKRTQLRYTKQHDTTHWKITSLSIVHFVYNRSCFIWSFFGIK